jgi:hypothetical protein
MMPPKTCVLLMALCAALTGCGRDSGQAHTPAQSVLPAQSSAPGLIRSPPVAQLAAEQLRSLSLECQKYPADTSSRGPYDAAYCEAAIAAWADAPLQMIPIIKETPRLNSPDSHQ